MKNLKQASARLGAMTIPLLGINPRATEERCVGCGQWFHLQDITLDERGYPRCAKCQLPPPQYEPQ